MANYKNLTLSEKLFLKWRHEALRNIPSVELSALLQRNNLIPHKPGIYIMWKKNNDRIYVGESNDVNRRLIQHATVTYPKQYIDREIRKYGPEHFRVAFLEKQSNLDKRRQREGYYVRLFNSYYNGYNGSKDGNPMSLGARIFRKYKNKFLKILFPNFIKQQRRKNYFKGWRKLKRYSQQLKRNRGR